MKIKLVSKIFILRNRNLKESWEVNETTLKVPSALRVNWGFEGNQVVEIRLLNRLCLSLTKYVHL